MALRDNIRVLYRDGLILGADELSDDQAYFRSALERRSLARDMFGIAWGLELTAQGGTASVDPGVAYGGDGKVIVLRTRENITHLLAGQTRDRSYAIFIQFEEREDDGASDFKYCLEALDPRVLEEYRFPDPIEVVGNSTFNQRPGARREPHADLTEPTTNAQSRVRLGVIKIDAQGQFSLQRNATRIPCGAGYDPSAEGAEYIGVVAATITHPMRWSQSIGQDEAKVAIAIEPESGVVVHDPLMLKSDVYFEGHASGDQAIHLHHAALPAPHETETGLLIEACDAVETTTILSANRNRIGAHVAIEASEIATFAKDVTVNAVLNVNGDSLFRKTTFQANVEIPNHKLTANQLAVLASAQIDTLTVEDLTVTGTVTSAQNTFTSSVTFQQSARFQNNIDVTGTARFHDDVNLDDPANRLTVSGASDLNGGATIRGTGLQVFSPTRMHDAITVERATTMIGPAHAQATLRADNGIAIGFPGVIASEFAVGIDVGGNLVLATSATGVIGISAGQSGGETLLVTSGRVLARINNTGGNAINPGTWLTLGNNGVLVPTNNAVAGTLVGKTLAIVPANANGSFLIVVSLA